MNAVLADSGRLSSSIHVATSLALLRAGEQSAAAAFNRIARRLSARLRDRPSDDSADQRPTTAQKSVPLIRSCLSLENLTSANLGVLNEDYGRTSSR
jgi:hypothetical protein